MSEASASSERSTRLAPQDEKDTSSAPLELSTPREGVSQETVELPLSDVQALTRIAEDAVLAGNDGVTPHSTDEQEKPHG